MELLAPAGSPEALTAAVQAGADAVYLGAGSFNARQSADNFDGDALTEAIRQGILNKPECHCLGDFHSEAARGMNEIGG